MALALALFALVILGALVSVAFAVGRIDRGAATATAHATRAQSAAEAALALGIDAWDPVIHPALPRWDGTPATEWSSGTAPIGGDPGLAGTAFIRRLNAELYLVRGVGQRLDRAGGLLAELSVAQLVRTVRPIVGAAAALSLGAPASFAGGAPMISGINGVPPQWGGGCAPPDPGGIDDVAAVRSAGPSGLTPQQAAGLAGVPVAEVPDDPGVTPGLFTDFADFSYAGLASLPGVKRVGAGPLAGVGPVVDAAGRCNRGAAHNLGEPRRPPAGGTVAACAAYAPVVHAPAPLTTFAVGARGQGTLLVDGDLELRGDFTWHGAIVVRGALRVSGQRNVVHGAVLVQGLAGSGGAIAGDLEIRYSSCALDQAAAGAATARPLGSRSWLQLY